MKTVERSVVPDSVIVEVQDVYYTVDGILTKFTSTQRFDSEEKWEARQDLMKVHAAFKSTYLNLLRESTVCRQRKKITTAFWNHYNRFKEQKDTILGNITMYSLMHG